MPQAAIPMIAMAAMSAVSVAGSYLLSKRSAGKPPTPEKPGEMPDPEAQQRAQRQSVAQQRARQGRASTILTDTESLGGG